MITYFDTRNSLLIAHLDNDTSKTTDAANNLNKRDVRAKLSKLVGSYKFAHLIENHLENKRRGLLAAPARHVLYCNHALWYKQPW